VSDSDLLARQGWGPADLEANHAGRLSDEQLSVLRRLNDSYWRRALAFSLPLPIASLAFAIFATIAWDIAPLFVLPIVGFLTIMPLLLYVGGRVRAVRADLAAGSVQEVAGKIDGWFLNTRTGQARLRIGRTRMDSYGPQSDERWKEVRRVLLDVVRSGHEVRAFYLPSSRLVVAAEPLTRSSE
jgi:hypothetical protein